MKRCQKVIFLFPSFLFIFALCFVLAYGLARPVETVPAQMILYPYRDCIGVYRSDAEYRAGKNPVEVIRTPILSLPESDQSALLRGIPLQNEEQLRQLREDFS